MRRNLQGGKFRQEFDRLLSMSQVSESELPNDERVACHLPIVQPPHKLRE